MQFNFDDMPLRLGTTETDLTVIGHVVIEDGDITEIMIDWTPPVVASIWSLDPLERLVWSGMYDMLAAHYDAEIISTADWETPDLLRQGDFI